MCFYPVCIILRPAAALSAAARGRSGPAPTPAAQPLPKAFLILRPTAAAAPGQKRSLLITRGRHSGAAELFSPRTPPPLAFARRAPPVPLGGPPRRGTGGWSPREPGGASRLDLHAERVPRRSRGEAPPAGTAGHDPPQAQLWRRRRAGRGPARTPPEVTPRISSHPDRALITCFPHLKKKIRSLRPNTEY